LATFSPHYGRRLGGEVKWVLRRGIGQSRRRE